MAAEVAERLLKPGCGPLTVEDWFGLPETPDQYELVGGMLVVAPPPDADHQDVVGSIFSALRDLATRSGGWAMVAPTGVVLDPQHGFEPDVLFLAPNRRSYRTRRGVEGPPSVVVEVLSPSTRRHDLGTKLPVYLAAGVEEVWIIDTRARTVAVHRPGEPVPDTAPFGASIPSRVAMVGTAGLECLPLFDD